MVYHVFLQGGEVYKEQNEHEETRTTNRLKEWEDENSSLGFILLNNTTGARDS